MTTFRFITILVLAIAPMACSPAPEKPKAAVEQVQADREETPIGKAVNAFDSKPKKTTVDIDRMISFVWWNQDSMIEALDLLPDQRGRMDNLLRAHLESWVEMTVYRRNGPKRVVQAIKNGEFETALEISDRTGEAAAFLDGGRMRLKVEAFSELTPEQMQKVIEEQPFLLTSKWVRASGRSS